MDWKRRLFFIPSAHRSGVRSLIRLHVHSFIHYGHFGDYGVYSLLVFIRPLSRIHIKLTFLFTSSLLPSLLPPFSPSPPPLPTYPASQRTTMSTLATKLVPRVQSILNGAFMKPASKPIKLETLFTTKHIELIQASIKASSIKQTAPEKVAKVVAEIRLVLAPAVEVRASASV